jgi:hypothetical protein
VGLADDLWKTAYFQSYYPTSTPGVARTKVVMSSIARNLAAGLSARKDSLLS